MTTRSDKPMPVLRLGVYLLILAVCGGVAAHELYYWLGGNIATGTILKVGKVTRLQRTFRFWADYEYFDHAHVRHVGRAENVAPVTRAGEQIVVQYLRHAPATSRPAASPAVAAWFGAVAGLAAITFVAEILIRRRRRTPAEEGREQ